MTDPISFEVRDSVAWIRMDDGKANALSPTMVDALDEALTRAEAEASVVVLAGREGFFSAGFDLKVMMSGPAAARALVVAGANFMSRLYEHPQPVIAACTGHALAGGALLLACADHRIGAKGKSKIGLNEIMAGMPVPVFAHELARDRLDPRELTRSVLGSHIYDPEAAAAAGWLDLTVDPAELEAKVQQDATMLAKLPQAHFARTKRTLRRDTIERIRGTLEHDLTSWVVGN